MQEHTVAPGGRHVEILGSYDPHLKKGVFKNDKIKYWIEKGAQVSDSVYNLLIRKGVIEGKKRVIKIKKPKVVEAAAETPVKAAEGEKEKPAEPNKEESEPEIKKAESKEPVADTAGEVREEGKKE